MRGGLRSPLFRDVTPTIPYWTKHTMFFLIGLIRVLRRACVRGPVREAKQPLPAAREAAAVAAAAVDDASSPFYLLPDSLLGVILGKAGFWRGEEGGQRS